MVNYICVSLKTLNKACFRSQKVLELYLFTFEFLMLHKYNKKGEFSIFQGIMKSPMLNCV